MRKIGPFIFVILTLQAVILILTACRDLPQRTPPPPFATEKISPEQRLSQAAQSAQTQSVKFDHITLEDGLSQSTVNCIWQDNQGYLWFGTMDGLNRYDGYTITVFKREATDPDSLSDNHIRALYEDNLGELWIGTDNGGLNRLDRDLEKFISFQHNPADATTISSNQVTAIREDHNGNLWVGTGNGLNKMDRDTGQFVHYPNAIDPQSETYGSNYITAIYEDQSHTLWIGTLGGLLTFQPDDLIFSLFPLVRPTPPRIPEGPERAKVMSIFEDVSGQLWIGTDGEGLFEVDPVSGSVNQFLFERNNPHTLSHNTINSIYQDKSGDFWIGTGGGLDRKKSDGDRFIHYRSDSNEPGGLTDGNIRSVFIDESGVIWVGTNIGGLNKYDPYKTKFLHIRSNSNGQTGISHPQVWTFFQDDLDYLWIGTTAGLDKWDRRTGQMIHYHHDPEKPNTISSDHITKITEDKNGDLWFATQGGLNRFVRSRDSFIRYLPDPENLYSLISPFINDILEDKYGNIWVGTAGHGIDKLERATNRFTHYPYREGDKPVDSLPGNTILCFIENSDGSLWVGTAGGLARFEPESATYTFYRHQVADDNSLSHDIVNVIHRDQAGILWLGTGNGLDRFDPEDATFTHYREEDGLANNTVLGILEDATGNLWLSTNHGLSRFNPQNGNFRNYDTSDGLQSLEFNGGAYYQNQSGEMFFGGINGFNVFRPEEIQDNPYVPPIVITDLQIGNESVPVGPESLLQKTINQTDRIELSGQDSVFTFELAALHYGSPEEIQYAYIMENFDTDWNYIGNRRYATYTNLPPGEYTFRAIGTNSDGVWNEEGVTINVSMPYPFWQTWWFVGLSVLVLATAIIGAYRLRTRNIAARTRELEEQVATRTAEIERRREIAEGLREILVLLNSNQSLGESLHYIVSQAARLTDAEDAIIFRHTQDNPMTIVATNPGGQIRYSPDEALIAITKNWAREAMLDKQPLVVPDLVVYWLAHPEARAGSLGTHRAMLGVPIFLGEEVFGGLLMFYNHERLFSDEDLGLGFTFADQATLAVANARLREQAEETAVAMERSRLARELHDAVTQTIFSASLIAETVPPVWEQDREEGRKLLQELRQLTRGALAEMRTLLLELRPAALEEAGLPDLLNQLAEAVAGRTGVKVRTDVETTCDLPIQVKVAMYRIAQESLNNVMKHARATLVEVCLRGCSDQNGVILSVRDNGRGFELGKVPPDRMGLGIIRERAQAIGAHLSIESQPGEGTQVAVEWHEDT